MFSETDQLCFETKDHRIGVYYIDSFFLQGPYLHHAE